MKLHIVLLGGKHERANVEVHDVRAVICEEISQAYDTLKKQWFGTPKGMHIDGWMTIHGVEHDGVAYQVQISDQPSTSTLKPYLINLGAYVASEFGEVHKYLVVAGHNKTDAKAQGKKAIEQHWYKPHTDAVVDVDECIELSLIDQKHLHLVEGAYSENTFKNDYIVIG